MKKRFMIAFCCLVLLLQLLPILPMAEAAGTETVDKGTVSQDLYYCRTELSKLPNGQKLVAVYDRIVAGVQESAAEIEIGLSQEEFKLVLDSTRRDHTELFWMGSTYSMMPSAYDETFIETMQPTYTMSGAQLADAKVAFEQAVTRFLSRLTPGMSEYEMEKALHDMLAANVEYVSSTNAHNAYGALVEGKSVCEGYAESLQYLLQRVGIQAIEVFGYGITDLETGAGENHAWNIVRIDGQYYLTDLTWDDQKTSISYVYFNQTSAHFDQDHNEWIVGYENGDYWNGGFDLPECTATAENYYIKNGLLVTTYTVESIANLLKANGLSVTLYLNTDVDAFLEWYGDNYQDILFAATGVYSGYKGYYTAFARGEINLNIEGCGHTQTTLVEAKAATCDEDGNTAYYVCNNESCKKWFSDAEAEYEILSHETVKLYSIGHDWSVRNTTDESTLVSRATNCQEYDTYWYVCATCREMSDTYTFTTNAGAHVDADEDGVCDLCNDGETPFDVAGILDFLLANPLILGGGGGSILLVIIVLVVKKIREG